MQQNARRPNSLVGANLGETAMKRIFGLVAIATLSCLMLGCTETTEVKRETTVETPEGSTTTTERTTIEQEGENPPPPENP
jgi:hypothetical protein